MIVAANPTTAMEFRCGTEAEVEALVSDFIERTLPRKVWTHQAHLIVGLWHVWHYSEARAQALLRERIRAFNTAVGIGNQAGGGYHETITQFYVSYLAFWLAQQTGERKQFASVVERLLDSELADRRLPLRFYSRECLFSELAREQFVAPDLQPLPYLSIST